MITKKSDDAVSPVIGVMLMVVITVVIAAVITAFATGVVGETEAAPVAVLDVEIHSNVYALEKGLHQTKNLRGPDLWITHISGDAVDTKDIELRFSWTHDGCSHYSTYSADGMKEYLSTTSGNHWVGDSGIICDGEQRKQALYVKSAKTPQRTEYESGGLNHYIGDVILTPGIKLTASTDYLPSGTKNTGSQFMDAIFNNYEMTANSGSPCTGGIMEHLEQGTAVDVMILHLPSNKAIYDKTVIVQ